jgi:hypothetical protein
MLLLLIAVFVLDTAGASSERMAPPNVDISDAAVERDIKVFCGTTDECRSRFFAYRDYIVKQYTENEGRRRGIDKIFARSARPDGVDWTEVERMVRYRYGEPIFWSPRYRSTVTCSTTSSTNRVTTTCHSY